MIHISSGLKFQGDSESAVRILRFYLCGLLNPYFWKILLAKRDSAIADVPTDKYVSAAGIHYSYMYESYSKWDFDIFWSGCCDILGSQVWNTLHSMHKVWIKRNYTEIQSIGEGIYKIVLKSVMEWDTCKYHSIKPFYHSFVCPFTNTLNFCVIPFDPHFVHTMECVSYLCHKIANAMHL